MSAKDTKQIYWHSEMPPLDAEAMGEQIVEATSGRVPGTLTHRDELWNQCYEKLMTQRAPAFWKRYTDSEELAPMSSMSPSIVGMTVPQARLGCTAGSRTWFTVGPLGSGPSKTCATIWPLCKSSED